MEPHQIEIIDLKSNRMFLKKTPCPGGIQAKDFFLGAKVLLYGRNYEIEDYADAYTTEQLGDARQKTVVVVLGEATYSVGKIIDAMCRNQLTVSSLRMLMLSRQKGEALYGKYKQESYFENVVQPLCARAIVAVEVVGEGSIEKMKQMAGPLRARYGNNNTMQQVIEVAENIAEAELYRQILFEDRHAPTATFNNCTCCVIQPHIIKDGKLGQVLDAVHQDGYKVTAMEMFNLDRTTAAEFLEVYDGVVPHYNDAVDQLTTGPCVALEVCAPTEAVAKFRQAAGPWDIDMAKELCPNSIRAKYGIDRVKNAIHCTDLPEDGQLESQYFFDILALR